MPDTVIAMIPARIGSTRLPLKNLALVGGKPLIAHPIAAAQEAGVFDRIVINADHPVFGAVAERYGVEFYERPKELGSSTTKSDDVVLDFMRQHPADCVAWVNPTSPFQTGTEIREVVQHFQAQRLDSLITVESRQVHCVYGEQPVNFDPSGKFAQTQDLDPVQPFVYSVMMWRTTTFAAAMEAAGHAFFSGKVGYYPVSRLSGLIIKTAADLQLADRIARAAAMPETEITYDELTAGLLP